MSDANRVRVAIAKTSAQSIPVPDDTPANGGAQSLKQLRITGTPNMAQVPQTITSNEIRPDREVTDLILVGVEAGGDIAMEQSYGALDDLLEGVFFNTWSAVPTGVISSSANDDLTISAAGSWIDGMIVRVEGLTTGDGVYVIASGGTTTTLTMDNLDGTEPVFAGAGTLKLVGYRVASATAALAVAGGVGTLTLGVNLGTAAYGTQVAGDWLQLSPSPGGAFDNVENQGMFRIVSITATTVLLEMLAGVTEDFNENIDICLGERLRPGAISVANSSFIIERSFTDQENDETAERYTRELFTGMAVNVWQEQLTPQQIATATATFFGQRAFARKFDDSDELYANANLQAIPFDAVDGVTTGLASVGANQVFSTASDVAHIGRAGVNLVDPLVTKNLVQEVALSINNNLRRRLAVGRFGAASVGVGELSITGTLNTYFDDITVYEDTLTSGFRTSINYVLRSFVGRAILTDLPNVAISGGAPDVPGKNTDVTIPIQFQAIRDPVLAYSIHKARFEYIADLS